MAKRVVKSFTLTLDEELLAGVANFMQQEECTQGEAVRTIMRMSLAATPMDGAIESARRRAFNEVRYWALDEAGRALAEIAKRLEQARLETVPPQGFPGANNG